MSDDRDIGSDPISSVGGNPLSRTDPQGLMWGGDYDVDPDYVGQPMPPCLKCFTDLVDPTSLVRDKAIEKGAEEAFTHWLGRVAGTVAGRAAGKYTGYYGGWELMHCLSECSKEKGCGNHE